MKKYKLIGKSIDYSLSPHICNYVFNQLNIDAKYEIENINEEIELIKYIELLKNRKIDGLNITVPYKEKIFKYLEELNFDAEQILSSNCISLNSKGNVIGYNTDWIGFTRMINRLGINVKNYKVIIIGYGGAGKAIRYSLQKMKINNPSIYSRKKIPNISFNYIDNLLNQTTDNSLIINTTPYHFINDSQNHFDDFVNKKYVWIDLLYTKLSTSHLSIIDENKYFNGLDMLIYQALASLDIWLRKNISETLNLDTIKNHLFKEFNVK